MLQVASNRNALLLPRFTLCLAQPRSVHISLTQTTRSRSGSRSGGRRQCPCGAGPERGWVPRFPQNRQNALFDMFNDRHLIGLKP